MNYYKLKEQETRREQWYNEVRKRAYEMFNKDGSGKIVQFEPPCRESLWSLIPLYCSGNREYIDLANNVLGRYNTTGDINYDKVGEKNGREFGVFQSNFIAGLFHRFKDIMTPAAIETCEYHCNALFRNYNGSAQPCLKFHGANDNMPVMATCGLILGGEAMGNQQAVKHGLWNLHQLRRHFSRCAWITEYGSSTYTAISLSGIAKLAEFSHNPEIRSLALQLEERIWAELALNFHPDTFMQAGPHLRSYNIDNVGHTHSLQFVYWLVLGEKISGRDPIQSFTRPDGKEIVYMKDNNLQTLATYCERAEPVFHLPEYLVEQFTNKKYPVQTAGRTEILITYEGQSGVGHTQTYMEKDFSMGTTNIPLCEGKQTNQLFVTYKNQENVESFKDAATFFYRYMIEDSTIGEPKFPGTDKVGEMRSFNQGWCYAFQKNNVGLLSCIPQLNNEEITTSTLKLCLTFSAHYGNINRVISQSGQLNYGDELDFITPLAIEAGRVYIHIIPLLPTGNKTAIRFCKHNNYDVIELINYEGEEKTFTREELATILNGYIVTIDSCDKYDSLETFLTARSDFKLLDYLFSEHRFLHFYREDTEFELVYTPGKFGVQTEAVDGRTLERPLMQTNQLDVNKLPFMTGKVESNIELFPWDKMDSSNFENTWVIGSRGLDGDYYKNVVPSPKAGAFTPLQPTSKKIQS